MRTVALQIQKPIVRDITLVLLASFIISLSGSAAIPLWFTPVPLATQNSCVLLMAALLGARRGSAATFLFLAQGAMGLPVFSNGGGLHTFFGPTGGYLFGYLIASYVVGFIAERNKSLLNTLFALSVGNLIVYFCGASYLSSFVGISKALLLGVAPFVLGDLVKTVASMKIIQWVRNR